MWTIFFAFYFINLIRPLERILFTNELFALLGIVILIKFLPLFFSGRQNKALFWFHLHFLFGLLYGVYSFFMLRDGSVFEFVRTYAMFYSCFCFYVGVIFYKKVLFRTQNISFLTKRRWVWNIWGAVFGTRIESPMLFGLANFKSKYFALLMIVLLVILAIAGNGTTPVILSLVVLLFYIIYSYPFLQKIIFSRLTIGVLFVFLFGFFEWFYINFYDFFNSISELSNADWSYEAIDMNNLWRLLFWVYEYQVNIKENFFLGIGYGTKLIDQLAAPQYLTPHNTDPHYEYTIGTHFSYLTLFIREGLLGVFLFMSFLLSILKQSFKYLRREDKLFKALSLSFLLINVSALFNVVLMSPMNAYIYWITAGMLFAAIQERRKSYANEAKVEMNPEKLVNL